MTACRDGPVVADLVGEIETFMREVEMHFGTRPLVYTTEEFKDAVVDKTLYQGRFGLGASSSSRAFAPVNGAFGEYPELGHAATAVIGPWTSTSSVALRRTSREPFCQPPKFSPN